MFKFFKEIYNEFIYLPKHGEPHEHAVLTRLVVSVAVILCCVSIIGYSAVAYFSDSVSTTLADISSANYDVTVTDSSGEVVASPYVVGYDESGTQRKFVISATGSASSGFCVVTIDGEKFETQIIKPGDSLELTVLAATDSEISFEPHWGKPKDPILERTVNAVDAVSLQTFSGEDDEKLYIIHTVEANETLDNIAYDYNVAANVIRYMYSVMWECDFDPEIEFFEGEELIIPVDPAPFEELIEAEYERIEAEKLAEEEAARAQEEIENENEDVSEEISVEESVESNENMGETTENTEDNTVEEPENIDESENVTLSDDTIEEFANELLDILKENLDLEEENETEIEEPIAYDYDIVINGDIFDETIYAADGEKFEIQTAEGIYEIYFTAAPDMTEGYVRIVLGGDVEFFTLPITPEKELRLEMETPENAEILFEIHAKPMDFEPSNGYVGDDLSRDDEESDKYIDYEMYVESEIIENGNEDISENDDQFDSESDDLSDENDGNSENITSETESNEETDSIEDETPSDNSENSSDSEENTESEQDSTTENGESTEKTETPEVESPTVESETDENNDSTDNHPPENSQETIETEKYAPDTEEIAEIETSEDDELQLTDTQNNSKVGTASTEVNETNSAQTENEPQNE